MIRELDRWLMNVVARNPKQSKNMRLTICGNDIDLFEFCNDLTEDLIQIAKLLGTELDMVSGGNQYIYISHPDQKGKAVRSLTIRMITTTDQEKAPQPIEDQPITETIS